ncbi:hypothetical protein GYMLUDRAFT_489373 [Collybiopsis luxurians FD-317 M1]|uniref:Uncharacterized protein n=1 Tax=Collybiopsis luxurians FD-317 M1 TaxID=944289 RepID=A0A0D0BFN5_9AGAR|nr:hypothetical protein GYMLUDRAFT_489373 [Collybiopsis luxurians FD-317 M1]
MWPKENRAGGSLGSSGRNLCFQASPTRELSSSVAWDVSEHVLRAVANAAQVSSMPFLGTLSTITLSIVDTIRDTRENQDALRQLATSACDLFIVVSNACQELQSLKNSRPDFDDSILIEDVKGLIDTFEKIRSFIKEHLSRPLIKKVVSSRSDLNVIQGYRDQLRHALDTFSLKSNISLRGTVSRIASQQESMIHSFDLIHRGIKSRANDEVQNKERETQMDSEECPTPSQEPVAASAPNNGLPVISTVITSEEGKTLNEMVESPTRMTFQQETTIHSIDLIQCGNKFDGRDEVHNEENRSEAQINSEGSSPPSQQTILAPSQKSSLPLMPALTASSEKGKTLNEMVESRTTSQQEAKSGAIDEMQDEGRQRVVQIDDTGSPPPSQEAIIASAQKNSLPVISISAVSLEESKTLNELVESPTSMPSPAEGGGGRELKSSVLQSALSYSPPSSSSSVKSNNPFTNFSTSSTSPNTSSPRSQTRDSNAEHSQSKSATNANAFNEAFLNAASIVGNITINNTTGDSVVVSKVDNSRRENFGNVYNSEMWNEYSQRDPSFGGTRYSPGREHSRRDNWKDTKDDGHDGHYYPNIPGNRSGRRGRGQSFAEGTRDPNFPAQRRRWSPRQDIANADRWTSYDTYDGYYLDYSNHEEYPNGYRSTMGHSDAFR